MIEIKEGNSVGPECLEEELNNGHVFIKSVDFVVWEEIQAGFNQNPADTHPRTTDETSRPSNLSVWRSTTLKSFWWEKLSGLQKLTIIQSLWLMFESWTQNHPEELNQALIPIITLHVAQCVNMVQSLLIHLKMEDFTLHHLQSFLLIRHWTSFYKSLYIWDDCHHAHFVLNHHLIDATHAAYGWAGFHWRRFWFSVLLEESWVTVKLDLERKTQQTEEGHVGWSCFRREVKQCWQRQKVLCENKALRWASFGYYSFISWESNAIYFVFMTWERRNYY